MTQQPDTRDPIEQAIARCDTALAQSKAHLDAFHADLAAIEARSGDRAVLYPTTDRIPLRPADLRTAVTNGIWAPEPTRPEPTEADRIEMERDDLRIQLHRERAETAAMVRDRDAALDERDQARREHGEALAHLTDAWAAFNRAGLQSPTASVADLIGQLAAERTRTVERLVAAMDERDQTRADVHRDIARDISYLAADPALLRDWLTTCQPAPVSYGELLHHLGEKIGRGDTTTPEPADDGQDDELDAADVAELLERGETVRVDTDGRIWRPGPGGTWTRADLHADSETELEAECGPTRMVLLIDIETDDEQDDEGDDKLPVWAAQLLAALDAWAQHWHRRRLDCVTPAQQHDTALLAAYDACLAGDGTPGSAPAGAQDAADAAWDALDEAMRPVLVQVADRAGRDATLAQIAADTTQHQAAVLTDTDTDHMSPAYPTTLSPLHMARGTGPGEAERDCPCPKAACGAVDSTRTDPGCTQHPAALARTMRSMHRADRCPANNPANAAREG
ncbi:hypothetical protein [Micromonospora rubida]|uniref:hypothetical protein n=1 Tax=Micromonospora rubida TaxID=2697657 RepID=UPI0013772598|nr:hypothetical protein [Micromonospora rubida]NBE80334.1 hypothetical protein [Micromonospora rubida]